MIMTRLGRSRVDMGQPFDLTEVGSAGFSPLQHEFVRDPISRSKSPPEDQDREFVVTCRILAISRVDFTTSTKPVDRNATLPVRRHMSQKRDFDLLPRNIAGLRGSFMHAAVGFET